MALVIVATAGAATANSYVTLARAEEIMEEVVHKADWSAAADATKNSALVQATRILDALVDWDGEKSATDQSLRFPRSGLYDREGEEVDDETIPADLERATTFLANELIKQDRTEEASMAGFKEIGLAGMKLVADRASQPDVIPDFVWAFVDYLGEYTGTSPFSYEIVRT
jgi:hypothetical protein